MRFKRKLWVYFNFRVSYITTCDQLWQKLCKKRVKNWKKRKKPVSNCIAKQCSSVFVYKRCEKPVVIMMSWLVWCDTVRLTCCTYHIMFVVMCRPFRQQVKDSLDLVCRSSLYVFCTSSNWRKEEEEAVSTTEFNYQIKNLMIK